MKPWDFLTLILFVGLTVVGLILHCLTFAGRDPSQLSLALWYCLQIGSALSLILALAVFLLREPETPLPTGWSLDKILAVCFLFFVVYAAFNFLFTGSVLLHDGHPAIINGQYAYGAHGGFLTISKEEFMKYMVLESRQQSGHWMAFFLFAIVALRRRRKG
jgi:hypothetical protein